MGRDMPSTDLRGRTIADIVLDHSECAKVFADRRIDYCCRGKRTLETACREDGVDVAALVQALESAIAGRKERLERDPRELSDAELVTHIVTRHHAYASDALFFLEPLAAKVARVHGAHNPKLAALRDAVAELAETLSGHMQDEEAVLFPACVAGDRRTVASELAAMEEEHRAVGTLLGRLRLHADDYAAPDWACGSYRTLLNELANLEADTLRHIHLENHVLAPRFAKTQEKLT